MRRLVISSGWPAKTRGLRAGDVFGVLRLPPFNRREGAGAVIDARLHDVAEAAGENPYRCRSRRR